MSAPLCQLCGSDLQAGTDLTRHILAESCIKAHGLRLAAVEQELALQRKKNALPPAAEANAAPTEPSHAPADAPRIRPCGACGLEFTARRQWATYCSPKCRLSAHLARRAAEATGSEQKTEESARGNLSAGFDGGSDG